jgi:DNA-binding transcriptional MerR regulator
MSSAPIAYLPFTVSEVAHCLAWGAAEKRHDLYLRRLRHWATAGILQPIGALYPGTGQSRQFDAEQVYRAAVLLRLADWNLSIGFLKAISDVMEMTIRRDGQLWEYAKSLDSRKADGDHVFLDLSVLSDDATDKPAAISIALVRGAGRAHPAHILMDTTGRQLMDVHTIDLTVVFAGARLP